MPAFTQRVRPPETRTAAQQPEMPRGTLLDFPKLLRMGRERGDAYRHAHPFPHIVMDDFLPGDGFRMLYDALPRLDDERVQWGNLNADLADGRPAQRYKHHLSNVLYMDPVVRQFFYEIHSPPFLSFLEELTGIPNLMPDPQMKGGGVHLTLPGGVLRVHADFTKHPSYALDRRLNLLLYMNPVWEESWGGHLELWTADMGTCAASHLPIANRCVIFSTTATSFHGHPHPLGCPEGMFRKSLAAYYYTAGRPEHEAPESGIQTLWQDLPTEKS
jgi:hypothetical protein